MILNSNVIILLIASGIVCGFDVETSKSRILSRRKRYVAFPEGSSFSATFNPGISTGTGTVHHGAQLCAACMTIGVIGQPAPTTAAGTFTFGLNWGVAYELPNSTETSSIYRKFNRHKKPMEQRRNRRQLYEKLETIMDKMGYNGRDCILKTLCETTQRLVPHGGNMIEEMFRLLFTMPVTKVLPIEPVEHTIYDAAHRLGHLLDSCDRFNCPLSLVDLAKGYYNAPAPTVDTALKPWTMFSSSFG